MNELNFTKKTCLIVTIGLLIILFKQNVSGQFYDNHYYDSTLMFEAGGSFGIMNCLTDLGGNKGLGKTFMKDLNVGSSSINGSIYLSALYKYAVGVRLEATFGRIGAFDSILKRVMASAQGRYERNLNFRTNITEVALIAEFHPAFIFADWRKRGKKPPKLSPYIAAGIGFFSFCPQGKLGNNWIDLQPLKLEGQGFSEYPHRTPYPLTQLNIPLGLGFKYELSPCIIVRAEFLHRILSTDYLDDVSTLYINADLFQKYFSEEQLQNALELSSNDRTNPGGPTGDFRKAENGVRGNPKGNDAYFTFNCKLGITFGEKRFKRLVNYHPY